MDESKLSGRDGRMKQRDNTTFQGRKDKPPNKNRPEQARILNPGGVCCFHTLFLRQTNSFDQPRQAYSTPWSARPAQNSFSQRDPPKKISKKSCPRDTDQQNCKTARANGTKNQSHPKPTR